MQVDEVITPSALVDKSRLISNVIRMNKKAEENRVSLRPHIKTHKCLEIAEIQKEHGSEKITVSTPGEAVEFARAGYSDITLAMPIAPDKIEGMVELSNEIELNLLIDSPNIVGLLDRKARDYSTILDVMVKVDCEYHRCGVDPHSETSVRLIQDIVDAPSLHFKGILTHAGHSYSAENIDEIKRIANQEQRTMVTFAKKLSKISEDLVPETVSIGSTPTISLTDEILEGITEVRPGNYVFFDFTQVVLGSCRPTDCALTVLASVIGSYQDHYVVDAGATTLSKDLGPTHLLAEETYGKVIADYDSMEFVDGHRITSLSQEHGKVCSESDMPEVGAKVRILPNHSCLVANLFDNYFVTDGDRITSAWPIVRTRYQSEV